MRKLYSYLKNYIFCLCISIILVMICGMQTNAEELQAVELTVDELPENELPEVELKEDEITENELSVEEILANDFHLFEICTNPENQDELCVNEQEISLEALEELTGAIGNTPANEFTLGNRSWDGFGIVNHGETCYFYNHSGTTIYWSNIYMHGEFQFVNREFAHGDTLPLLNNSGCKVVIYFKYDAQKHTIITTSCPMDTWRYLDIFPVMTNWEYEAVRFCADRGLMLGTGDHYFDPKSGITRAMLAEIIYRMAGKPKTYYIGRFRDVPKNEWYTDAVMWASWEGIIHGYTDGAFRPDTYITREEAVALLRRYAAYKGIDVYQTTDLSWFADYQSISSWAIDDVNWAVYNEVMKGIPTRDGRYFIDPKGFASRAECASLIKNFVEKIY